MKLYSYFRSSASFRVRIALNLKALPYEYVPVHLMKDGGHQLRDAYRRLSPDALVPTLVEGEGEGEGGSDSGGDGAGDDEVAGVYRQSLAIIEYLDETHPTPPLLPANPADRAHARAIAYQIACEIHPLNNLRVLKYLKHTLKVGDEPRNMWYRHWIDAGFASLETLLAKDPRTGMLSIGDTPTLGDLCIVPQVWNAHRLEIDTTRFPTVHRIYEYAATLDAFARAAPDRQPDAE